MTGDRTTRESGNGHLAGHLPRVRVTDIDDDGGEGACAAFGYLRGVRDRAAAVEFRFLTGNSTWFPYTWLGNWQFDPSEGLLLKFTGDLVYLVLIRGSNLNRPLGGVIWIREMDESEIRTVGESGPTVDSIEVAEFESQEELKAWLQRKAPAFQSKEHQHE
jgi:hypothetical protein